MINHQPIEKRIPSREDGRLDVHSLFYTIQGEGPFTGVPAVFLRLAGCNLQCPSCDTDYTDSRKLMGISEIVDHIKDAHKVKSGLVVITGGEPFRQDLSELLQQLIDAGFYVQIETNGTLEPSKFKYSQSPDLRRGVYIVCSPKAGKVNATIDRMACAYKYVIAHDSVHPKDGLPLLALSHSAKPHVARPGNGFQGMIYLQPMDSRNPLTNEKNLKTAIASCLEYGYTLQLQVHKLLDME